MSRKRNRILLLLFAILLLGQAASAGAVCKVTERFPGGLGSVTYQGLNPNLGDWGSIFRDADDDACAATARQYFEAKLQSQNTASGGWTGWLKGGDIYLMTGAALRLGARGLLSSTTHNQILSALQTYYGATVGGTCSISGGEGCMDEYTAAAAGFAWAGTYLVLTQSKAGTLDGGSFHQKARDYIKFSLSPAYSACVHHISDPVKSTMCTACDTGIDAATLKSKISAGTAEVLSWEHVRETPNYGAGLLTSVGIAALGLRRGGSTYVPTEMEKVIAHGLVKTAQLHAPASGVTECSGAWLDNCVKAGCDLTGQTCITTNFTAGCPVPDGGDYCRESFNYTPSMFPVKGLLQREFALTTPLYYTSGKYQFDKFNGTCPFSNQNRFRTADFNDDFFNDGRYVAYYVYPVVWSESSAQSDPKPRLAGVNPVQHVDNPTPGAVVRSGSTLSGWAWAGDGDLSALSFAFSIDGTAISQPQGFAYGGWRNDVCTHYSLSNPTGTCPVGWSGTFVPPVWLTTGNHTLKVTITSPTGSVSTFQRGFNYQP